jgi:hypothetical protein
MFRPHKLNRAKNTANKSPFSKQVNCNVKVKSAVWSGMTPCNVTDNYQRLGESAALFLFLDNGTICSSESSNHQTDCTT